MRIQPFLVEEWMNEYETGAKYNIAETCVDSISLDTLFELCGLDGSEVWSAFCKRRLTYGDIEGSPDFLQGICGLYEKVQPEHVIPTHGAAGANHHVFYSLIEPGDHVISVMPTYQQLYSIPASLGARMDILKLNAEDGYLPKLDALARLVRPETRMICINNPNNPTGALMPPEMLEAIIDMARGCGAYILCDEVYRHLTQDDVYSPSIADLYEKGISVSSMSKVFSLAGIRLGWIACRDKDVVRSFMSHRDYNLISCGMLDEQIAAIALNNRDKILARSRGIVRSHLPILDQWIEKEQHLHYVRPQAGTTALVHYDYPMSSYDMCRLMYVESGAFVTPGDCFGEPKSMRIGYACSEETLRGGLEAISRFIRAVEKTV